MEVFRISKEVYAQSLRSSGSANRWNTKGQQVIYTGASRSLSSLELVVHRGAIQPTSTYKVMVISIADDDYLMRTVQLKELPANWRTLGGYAALQTIGSNWYTSQESLILKVPSAIIIYEYNYIINTEHPDFGQHVQLVRIEDYFWDSRLL
ncbi:RES family NAD+ phosphorylase [Spirosoma sp. KNUC1025]|uniref:RES family NAD+ phosphorylase n=1 Tax=Spirosoma sp. KNUC1025 TaxID=2894082 RepID=UPI001E4BE803|nr:RES family NAD+ phosphorylase [Spirosoma sp. KNUC1025]UFH57653.1 RES family NAD+ phosphorylase [Spirosoma sp. KNUC1025]